MVCSLAVPVCNTLQRTAAHCNTCLGTYDMVHASAVPLDSLQHTVTLQHTATHCNTLQHTAVHCITLQHIAAHCSTLKHTATHCNTLHNTLHLFSHLLGALGHLRHGACLGCTSWFIASHCNTLQHTATHCNTSQATGSVVPVCFGASGADCTGVKVTVPAGYGDLWSDLLPFTVSPGTNLIVSWFQICGPDYHVTWPADSQQTWVAGFTNSEALKQIFSSIPVGPNVITNVKQIYLVTSADYSSSTFFFPLLLFILSTSKTEQSQIFFSKRTEDFW